METKRKKMMKAKDKERRMVKMQRKSVGLQHKLNDVISRLEALEQKG